MKSLALLVLVGGCGYRERARVIHPSELGSATAVITNYLSAPRRFGSPTEDTPGGVSREAIVDEARLETVAPGEACVTVVERTHVDLDMPLSDWNLTLGGHTVNPSDERVTVGTLPAGRYATLIYTGLDGGIEANGALLDWGAQQGLSWDVHETAEGDAFGARLETFLTDPDVEPDTAKWETEVAIRLADQSA